MSEINQERIQVYLLNDLKSRTHMVREITGEVIELYKAGYLTIIDLTNMRYAIDYGNNEILWKDISVITEEKISYIRKTKLP